MNKCDGIKILELDPKRILEGNEYMVIAKITNIENNLGNVGELLDEEYIT
jgi:hypothetical protein